MKRDKFIATKTVSEIKLYMKFKLKTPFFIIKGYSSYSSRYHNSATPHNDCHFCFVVVVFDDRFFRVSLFLPPWFGKRRPDGEPSLVTKSFKRNMVKKSPSVFCKFILKDSDLVLDVKIVCEVHLELRVTWNLWWSDPKKTTRRHVYDCQNSP